MPPTTIHNPPPLDSFTTLADHQSHTPSTFYGAKPVLHFHAVGIRALTTRDQSSKLPIFASSSETSPAAAEAEGAAPSIIEVDVFVNSENLTLFNPATATGVSIPYPSVSLHAIQRLQDPSESSTQVQGFYMQLDLSDEYGATDEDEPEAVELTLIPGRSTEVNIQTLFEAVSNCSNLHPDPIDQDDEDMDDEGGDSRIVFEGSVGYEGISGLPGVQQGAADGGLPPPFPGSGGWITAENVSEYFDEAGNWIRGGDEPSLGAGAGRVRTRDEMDGEEEAVNGHGEESSDDSKRPRTD